MRETQLAAEPIRLWHPESSLSVLHDVSQNLRRPLAQLPGDVEVGHHADGPRAEREDQKARNPKQDAHHNRWARRVGK